MGAEPSVVSVCPANRTVTPATPWPSNWSITRPASATLPEGGGGDGGGGGGGAGGSGAGTVMTTSTEAAPAPDSMESVST